MKFAKFLRNLFYRTPSVAASCLLLRLKFRSAMAVSQHSAFMGNCRLLVTRFIVLSTQRMKEMSCEFGLLLGTNARIWNLEG